MLPAFNRLIARCEVERFGVEGGIEVKPFDAPLNGDALDLSDQRGAHTFANGRRKDINRIEFGLVREQRPDAHGLAVQFCDEANLSIASGLHSFTFAHGPGPTIQNRLWVMTSSQTMNRRVMDFAKGCIFVGTEFTNLETPRRFQQT